MCPVLAEDGAASARRLNRGWLIPDSIGTRYMAGHGHIVVAMCSNAVRRDDEENGKAAEGQTTKTARDRCT